MNESSGSANIHFVTLYKLIITHDYELWNQMVPASLLAAGVFDKPFLLEFKETAVHGGLRIGGVGYEFRGAATGMLFDVVEYSVELLFRWCRWTFFAFFSYSKKPCLWGCADSCFGHRKRQAFWHIDRQPCSPFPRIVAVASFLSTRKQRG